MGSAPRVPVGAAANPREIEERFRILVESVRDYAIFILDPDGKVATWNIGAERIKGYRAHEIVGKHFSIFYPPEDVAAGKTDRELEIAIRTGRFEEEGGRIRKDGSRMWANDPEGGLGREVGPAMGGSSGGTASRCPEMTELM